jgi:hypothetical protein
VVLRSPREPKDRQQDTSTQEWRTDRRPPRDSTLVIDRASGTDLNCPARRGHKVWGPGPADPPSSSPTVTVPIEVARTSLDILRLTEELLARDAVKAAVRAAARRPSWPLVAMITVVAASTITALKMRNLAVFDAGTT